MALIKFGDHTVNTDKIIAIGPRRTVVGNVVTVVYEFNLEGLVLTVSEADHTVFQSKVWW